MMEQGTFSSLDFRKALGKFCTGVTVVTTDDGERVHGMTANSFTSVSLHPPLVLVAVDKRAVCHQLVLSSAQFGVSILLADQLDVSNHFAGKPSDEVAGQLAFERLEGIPVLSRCLTRMACRLWATYDGGDHSLFVGEVLGMQWDEGNPLLYFQGKYGQLHS